MRIAPQPTFSSNLKSSKWSQSMSNLSNEANKRVDASSSVQSIQNGNSIHHI